MNRYPILFNYRELIVGNGFVASVESAGRCLMEDFGEEDVWVRGVHPSGFSAGANDQKSASDAFQREHRVALLDIAHEASDFDHFKEMVHTFHAQKSRGGMKEWWEAVKRVRSGEINSDWLKKVSADTEPKITVQCISLAGSEGVLASTATPIPALNPGEHQIGQLAA